jgi:hypothetical protein
MPPPGHRCEPNSLLGEAVADRPPPRRRRPAGANEHDVPDGRPTPAAAAAATREGAGTKARYTSPLQISQVGVTILFLKNYSILLASMLSASHAPACVVPRLAAPSEEPSPLRPPDGTLGRRSGLAAARHPATDDRDRVPPARIRCAARRTADAAPEVRASGAAARPPRRTPSARMRRSAAPDLQMAGAGVEISARWSRRAGRRAPSGSGRRPSRGPGWDSSCWRASRRRRPSRARRRHRHRSRSSNRSC